LNLALNNKVNSWGEKDFWNVWYLYYQEYFTSYDEKVIRVNNGIMTSVLILKKTDFTTSKDLDVAIINKSDKKAEEEQDRLNIPNYQMLLQSPELSQFEKLLLNRHIMRIS
jgi:cellobiose-specific phosphotransferase system component IIB